MGHATMEAEWECLRNDRNPEDRGPNALLHRMRLVAVDVCPLIIHRMEVRADSRRLWSLDLSSCISQRDFVSQPRVGAKRLPWVDVRCGSQPQRGCVLVLACRKDATSLAAKRRNPFRVENVAASDPG